VGNVRSDVLKHVWHLFRENGVEIPFPQREVRFAGPLRLERDYPPLRQNSPSR
jgi:small-conductance mechanosensitive channel